MKILMLSHRAKARGFTLLELMVTLTVVAILGIIAVPNFHTFMLNQRRDSVVDALTASLQYARNQALNLNEKTTLCAGQPGISCTGGAWSSGWEVVQLPAGATTVALTSHVIQVASTAPTIRAVNTSIGMTFAGNGLVTFNPTTVTDEFIQVCDSRGSAYARAVEVNNAGYIQSSSKVGFTPSNVAITCP
jgi:type IV fimbrial biogenesis protein FimT